MIKVGERKLIAAAARRARKQYGRIYFLMHNGIKVPLVNSIQRFDTISGLLFNVKIDTGFTTRMERL
mgnify:CR=1 FL=1